MLNLGGYKNHDAITFKVGHLRLLQFVRNLKWGQGFFKLVVTRFLNEVANFHGEVANFITNP